MENYEATSLINDIQAFNRGYLKNNNSIELPDSFKIEIDTDGIFIEAHGGSPLNIAKYTETNWFIISPTGQTYGDLSKVIISAVLNNWVSNSSIKENGFSNTAQTVSEIAKKELQNNLELAKKVLGL